MSVPLLVAGASAGELLPRARAVVHHGLGAAERSYALVAELLR